MQEHKVALVTGASNGIGLETALQLAQKGFRVVLLCRNQQRGEAAVEYIKAKSGQTDVSLMICDLGNMSDIRNCCEQIKRTYHKLDILINNAGVLNFKRQLTKDGLEEHFGVCHIGHFLLTNLLLECMAEDARIVMVSSVAHKMGKINFDDLAMAKGYSAIRAYSRAKLCNILFARELARRLRGTGITINCVHPGVVGSNIGAKRSQGQTTTGRARRFFFTLLRPVIQTPEQGALTTIYVATSDACAGVSGAYFANCKPAKVSPKAEDATLAKKLWQVSVCITGLDSQAPTADS